MRIVAFPQWQGATFAGAEEALPAGCRALAALAGQVLGAPVEWPNVPAAPSPVSGGIAHRESLAACRDTALAGVGPGGPVLTIGGDCSADLVPVGFARMRHGPDLTAVWFDAHADCNTPETSPSGALHGMVLRALLGDGPPDIAASPAVEPAHAVLVGTRVFDPEERRVVDDGLVRHVPPPADPLSLRRAVGSGPVYLHVDVDVLDPAAVGAGYYREPGGLTVEQLVAAIDAVPRAQVVGAAITECTTADPAVVRALSPVIEALGRALGDRTA